MDRFTAAHPITYTFRDASGGQFAVEASDMADAFDHLPEGQYAFVQAIDSLNRPVFG